MVSHYTLRIKTRLIDAPCKALCGLAIAVSSALSHNSTLVIFLALISRTPTIWPFLPQTHHIPS